MAAGEQNEIKFQGFANKKKDLKVREGGWNTSYKFTIYTPARNRIRPKWPGSETLGVCKQTSEK